MEEKLIMWVCSYPELYDTVSYFCRNGTKKELAQSKTGNGGWRRSLFFRENSTKAFKLAAVTQRKKLRCVYCENEVRGAEGAEFVLMDSVLTVSPVEELQVLVLMVAL
ncbi:hypothetical protein ABVT39_001285 [Epinephelus coioides]